MLLVVRTDVVGLCLVHSGRSQKASELTEDQCVLNFGDLMKGTNPLVQVSIQVRREVGDR